MKPAAVNKGEASWAGRVEGQAQRQGGQGMRHMWQRHMQMRMRLRHCLGCTPAISIAQTAPGPTLLCREFSMALLHHAT